MSSLSSTTVLLIRMLLEDMVGVRPVYQTCRQDLDVMLAAADAAVVIGDEALQLQADRRSGLAIHDAGTMWRTWAGLPMVFAVWAIRRDFALAHPARVRAVHEALTNAVRRARNDPTAVALAGIKESEKPPFGPLKYDTLVEYYRSLDYSLGKRQVAAMNEFSNRAVAKGEHRGMCDLSLFHTCPRSVETHVFHPDEAIPAP